MKLSDAIQRLTELKQKHDDIDVAFQIWDKTEPDLPLGNDFVEIQVDKDSEGFYATFITKPRRSA